jgi:hypothetical protein
MLRFAVYRFRLGERFYVLLPKLNEAQLAAFGRRFEAKGYALQRSASLVAKNETQTIHLDPSGFSWSSTDPSDAVLPAIPEILAMPKKRVPIEELASRYFLVRKAGRSIWARMSTRVESSGLWRNLRAEGSAALTPDEKAVALFLIGASSGCELVTDFPTTSGKPRMIGKKQYYNSFLSPSEGSTLRVVGQRGSKNAYLPEHSVLRFQSFKVPQRRAFVELFESLGEWCSFIPT